MKLPDVIRSLIAPDPVLKRHHPTPRERDLAAGRNASVIPNERARRRWGNRPNPKGSR